MKSLKNRVVRIILFPVIFSFFFLQFAGCEKDPITNTIIDKDTTYYDIACPVRGTYAGTSTPSVGGQSAIVYTFEDDNFVVGRHQVGQSGVTFGGYRNTCDSVILSVYYTVNNNYYRLKGKFSNNRNTISGAFNNLTTPSDFGTFTMSK